MHTIKIRYFAALREQAQCEQEQIEVSCSTYGDLYNELAKKHSFTLPKEMIQVAVNDRFTRLESLIETGATVVFIPPVAGG